MEVDQGAPKGPADFAGPLWRELFQHACKEANRLGLEINMNNDAGWCGSGGPWITPELSMQRVVWTETVVQGPKSFDGVLARPQAVRDFYQDIAVLAMPAPEGKARIPDIEGKSSAMPQHFPPQRAKFASLPAESVIPRDRVVDLTGEDGRQRQAHVGRSRRASGSSCDWATRRPARTIIPRRRPAAGWNATSSARRRRKRISTG